MEISLFDSSEGEFYFQPDRFLVFILPWYQCSFHLLQWLSGKQANPSCCPHADSQGPHMLIRVPGKQEMIVLIAHPRVPSLCWMHECLFHMLLPVNIATELKCYVESNFVCSWTFLVSVWDAQFISLWISGQFQHIACDILVNCEQFSFESCSHIWANQCFHVPEQELRILFLKKFKHSKKQTAF